MIQTTDDKKF